MIVGLIVGDRMQNIIPSFWSTFLFSGPPSGVLPDLQSGIKNVRSFRALRICNPPHLDDKKGFAILLAADCKSAGLKEVGAFLDDGLQIRRNEMPRHGDDIKITVFIHIYISCSSTSFQSINPLPVSSSSTARAMTLRLSALKGSV